MQQKVQAVFGYIAANLHDLDDAERLRYRSVYCGLCRALKRQHGQLARFALTYDMTFLVLLLNSLYEPEEELGSERCAVHPTRSHPFTHSRFTDYAADLSVALAYFKCLDDWSDDRSVPKRAYAAALKGAYGTVKTRLPRQCAAIERELGEIARIEDAFVSRNRGEALQMADGLPDDAARSFGRLLGELFVPSEDYWAAVLRAFGAELGRFIYFMDAACDLDEDKQRGRYNPFAGSDLSEGDRFALLASLAGRATAPFEKLPLEKDLHLMRGVLYSGMWQKGTALKQKKAQHDRRDATPFNATAVRRALGTEGQRL